MKTWLGLTLALAIALMSVGCGNRDNDGTGNVSTAGPNSSAMGPGISISEAISSNLTGPLLINGFLLIRDDQVRFCSSLTESFPPQCSGASLEVKGLDAAEVEGLVSENGVSWSGQATQLLGEIQDGVIRVSENTSA